MPRSHWDTAVALAKAGFVAAAPLPEVVARGIPEIASDPRGFDRAAFHDAMNSTIVTFFKQALSDCARN